MQKKPSRTFALTGLALVVIMAGGWQAFAQAQYVKTPYPSRAPLDEYLMERNAEIALAQSAASESISRDAGV